MKSCFTEQPFCKQRRNLSGQSPLSALQHGFTLIEVMIVAAIIAMVAMMGIPAIYRAFHPESLQTAVKDVVEACAKARSRAIWESRPVDLIWIPLKGEYQVVDAPRDVAPVDPNAPPTASPVPNSIPGGANPDGKPPASGSGQLSDRVALDMLDVNFRECKNDDEARICFYPNGTCDECTIILRSLDNGESRKISLELVTALPDVTIFP
jgi:prepilin-type N-terminal cleavage/methylation domain-containing protein